MDIVIRTDEESAVRFTAGVIAGELRCKPSLVLGLATGRTMEGLYSELGRMHREAGLDFSGCITFNLDEYAGLAPGDSNSYHYYMNKHLFSHVNIDSKNTHIPNGMAERLPKECERYELAIRESGGIDLQLLGIGVDGHIGFNEPLSGLYSRTRVQKLAPATIDQNSGMFNSRDQVPRYGITMGVGTILECRRCILLATGSEKAEVVAKAVEGPVTAMITASALQLHPQCCVVLDQAAAGGLKEIGYYQSMFENET